MDASGNQASAVRSTGRRKKRSEPQDAPKPETAPRQEKLADHPCPTCGGPLRAEDADRECRACRLKGQAQEVGSLLELRTAMELFPQRLDKLPLWREIRYVAGELWGHAEFQARPLGFLLDWLAAKHGKAEHQALWMQRSEVLALLRAELAGDPSACEVVFFGEGLYQCGRCAVRLQGSEANVLEALVELAACSKGELERQSGENGAVRLLRGIKKKYPLLAPTITLPGKKGLGGYRTTIQKVCLDDDSKMPSN